jgi:hypothetical protein
MPKKKKATTKKTSRSVRKKRPAAVEPLALAEIATIAKAVDVSLTGGFYHGWITVSGTSISLGPSGKGQATITVVSPISVAIGMSASGPTTYSLSTTINGVTKSETDTIDGGTYSTTFTYPSSDFNL